VIGESENPRVSVANAAGARPAAAFAARAVESSILLWRERARQAGLLCLYEAVFYVAYRFGMGFGDSLSSPFWFPDAVLLTALLLSPARKWWVWVVAPLPIRLLVAVPPGVPLWFLMVCFLTDSARGVLVAAGMRFSLKNPLRFASVRDFVCFCFYAVLLGPAVSAFAGAAARRALGYDYWSSWQQWVLGVATAQLMITPAVLYGALGDAGSEWRAAAERWKEASLLLAGLIAGSFFAFDCSPGFLEPGCYLPVPFLFWAAIRFGMFGASVSMLVLTGFAISGAIMGMEYFPARLTSVGAADLQSFLLIRAVPLYLVAIVAQQKSGVENALRESEKRFKTVADTAPILIWMSSPDKLCDFFNQAWLDFTGRTLEEERGNGWANGVHPDDLQRCLGIYNRAFDSRRSFETEYRLRRHDGEYRWILGHGLPRYTTEGSFAGYIGSAIDITERIKQETALRNSEERYREVVESQTDLVCRYLPDTTLTFVNEAYCRFFGKTRAELIGRKFLELIPEHTRELARNQIARVARRKQPAAWEHEVLIPGVGIGWQYWFNHPVFGPTGEIEEFQAIGHDVTDRKRAEELSRRLIHAQEEERKRVARELHDDFNQRLAAHAIALSNLKERIKQGGGVGFSLEESLEKLQREATGLGEEIRLIAHELHPTSIEHEGLERALRSLCGEFSALTELRVDFQFDNDSHQIPSNISLCCFRVVQEALRNIVKHARADEAQIKVVVAQDRVFLTVADNGMGMKEKPADMQGGLGMSSMKERVELLSGEFRIASREPRGTIVMVTLPL
jgi:PAS domain S-box-containing protein